jgi:FkbM family methyltransferase
VRERARFVPRQFGGRRTATYTLRESGLTVHLRHGARDVAVMNEIFGGTGGRNCYEPPAEVAALLDGTPGLRILDVGANIGLFSLFALTRWPDAHVVGLEPDPANFALLRRAQKDNALGARWEVAQVAAYTAAGHVPFAAGLFSDAHVAVDGGEGTIQVPTVDFFAGHHEVDLMKMDIEGAEWPILLDARLATLEAKALVLEWHRRECPEADPRAAAVRVLADAGYAHVQDVEDHGESGVFWAWR